MPGRLQVLRAVISCRVDSKILGGYGARAQ